MRHAKASIPNFGVDLFDDASILEPYNHYRALRALGPVSRLTAQGYLAVTRDAEVRDVLARPETFISGRGISLNEIMNGVESGSVIISDGARHREMRTLELEPLKPGALNALRQRIFHEASDLVDRLLSEDRDYDVVTDLAQHLPLTIVMELGGLPPVARDKMLSWAAAVFNLQGPLNARSEDALPALSELLRYITEDIDRDSVAEGSWAARAFRLADEGVIATSTVADLLMDFIAPSLDTTIAATGTMLMLLGCHPDQWQLLRENRARVPNAINEALRLESPIRCFTRFVAANTEVSGVSLAAGERVAVFYAAANRDDAKWPDAETFDVQRRNADQLAFGSGAHQCIGNNLARLEMTAILNAMLDRIDKFEVGEPRFALNNILRTLKAMPIRLHRR